MVINGPYNKVWVVAKVGGPSIWANEPSSALQIMVNPYYRQIFFSHSEITDWTITFSQYISEKPQMSSMLKYMLF